MENVVCGVKSVLHDIQKFAAKENEISSLSKLNEIISSSQDEIDFLYNSDGIDIIISLLETDNKLANICLKILAKASKRHEKVRSKLLEKNIFGLLAVKLKSETDFSYGNLIMCSALIVVLLQGNYEAQNQMRTSGCLSSMLNILSCILDEKSLPLPTKITELVIYTLIASNKVPRHVENQTQVGWITPKILEHLGKQTIFSGSDQLRMIKCFWFFLKTLLDESELNQQIFLNSSGSSILFRNIQSISKHQSGNYNETGDVLVKMTAVLIKLKSNKEFLHQASGHCPVMILCNLLKTYNTLVIQQTFVFLDCLTREFPRVVLIMSDDNLRRMKAVKIFLHRSKMTREHTQSLWNRMDSVDGTESQQKCSLSSKLQPDLDLKNENQYFRETASGINLLQTHFCVVHDAGSYHGYQTDLKPSVNSIVPTESKENKRRIESRNKFKFSTTTLSSRRRELRERERRIKKIVSQNFSHSSDDQESSFNIIRIAGRRIAQIFQSFFSFFIRDSTDDFINRFSQ